MAPKATDVIRKIIQDNMELIERKDFESIYSRTPRFYISQLTKFFYSCDIDPLLYMDHVPRSFAEQLLLTEVVIPDNITSIGNDAFYWCDDLTSVTIGNNVTSIGNSAFSDCTSLTDITIPGGVKAIGNFAFERCKSLTSVAMGNGVKTIGDYAFYACAGLTSVTIPNSVTSIEHDASGDCSNLTSIKFNGTKAQWQAIKKDSEWKVGVPTSCVIHCTDGDIKI